MAKPITLRTDDKPHLSALMESNPKVARDVIKVFVDCMEECVEQGWHELPESFGGKLTLADLVKGVLHGALDLQSLNPEAYAVYKEEVHPFAMLMPRKNPLDPSSVTRFNWREWYRLDQNAQIDQSTVEAIIRKLLRYYRYVDVEALANALIYKQVKTYEGLGERNVKTLPFYPALRYQQEHLGDLSVGRFFDSIGGLDCGIWNSDDDSSECPACSRPDIRRVGNYHWCLACNAAWKDGEDEE